MKNIENFIYVFCTITILLMSCNGNVNVNKPVNTADIIAEISSKESDEQKVKSELLEIIHPALFKELDDFTRNMKLYPEEHGNGINIVFASFEQRTGECCAFIVPHHYYRNENLSGYIILNEIMVAFYSLEDECNCNLVDATKLKKDKTDKYPNEYSRPQITYDPSGKIFKINKEDKSLELIFSGQF